MVSSFGNRILDWLSDGMPNDTSLGEEARRRSAFLLWTGIIGYGFLVGAIAIAAFRLIESL